jgi:hypothetical protein
MRLFRKKKQKVEGSKRVSVAAFYEDITLREWCAWHQARTDMARLCAALSITEDEARQIPTEQAKKVLEIFGNAVKAETMVDRVRVDLKGKQYGMIPDLTAITLGEHVDLVNNVKKDNLYITLPKAVAILYRPVTKVLGGKYDIEPYDHKKHLSADNLEAIGDMPMNVVAGASLFFSTICKELSANLELSLVKELRQTMKEI